MANARQRDDVYGTAFSASAENYLARRQGTLTRASDGFRSPTLPFEPRRPTQPGYKPDSPVRPYAYNPKPPAGTPLGGPPRTWAYFRAPSLGAPHVGLPDREATQGKLQQSGAAWGRFHDSPRHTLMPATGPGTPSHSLGYYRPGNPSAHGLNWRPPTSPRLYVR